MKKSIKCLLMLAFALSIVGCNNKTTEEKTMQTRYVHNGGFESSDLSGWTIEYGDAYTNDSVSSRENFYFKNDNRHNLIDINKTGTWYLSGQGFDLSYSHGRTGAIRSSNFYIDDTGIVSMKLAGGALTKGKGELAENKKAEELCFVGVYLASNDKMIAYQTNKYFLEHTESYVNVNKYNAGVYVTDKPGQGCLTAFNVDTKKLVAQSNLDMN